MQLKMHACSIVLGTFNLLSLLRARNEAAAFPTTRKEGYYCSSSSTQQLPLRMTFLTHPLKLTWSSPKQLERFVFFVFAMMTKPHVRSIQQSSSKGKLEFVKFTLPLGVATQKPSTEERMID
jgi:hypothetical protein